MHFYKQELFPNFYLGLRFCRREVRCELRHRSLVCTVFSVVSPDSQRVPRTTPLALPGAPSGAEIHAVERLKNGLPNLKRRDLYYAKVGGGPNTVIMPGRLFAAPRTGSWT